MLGFIHMVVELAPVDSTDNDERRHEQQPPAEYGFALAQAAWEGLFS